MRTGIINEDLLSLHAIDRLPSKMRRLGIAPLGGDMSEHPGRLCSAVEGVPLPHPAAVSLAGERERRWLKGKAVGRGHGGSSPCAPAAL